MKLARARFSTEHWVTEQGLPRVGVVWAQTWGWNGPEGWRITVSAGKHRFTLRRSAYR